MKITNKIEAALYESLEFMKSHPNFKFLGIYDVCTEETIEYAMEYANQCVDHERLSALGDNCAVIIGMLEQAWIKVGNNISKDMAELIQSFSTSKHDAAELACIASMRYNYPVLGKLYDVLIEKGLPFEIELLDIFTHRAYIPNKNDAVFRIEIGVNYNAYVSIPNDKKFAEYFIPHGVTDTYMNALKEAIDIYLSYDFINEENPLTDTQYIEAILSLCLGNLPKIITDKINRVNFKPVLNDIEKVFHDINEDVKRIDTDYYDTSKSEFNEIYNDLVDMTKEMISLQKTFHKKLWDE